MMWVMVLFDLPVGTKAERKRATGFRNFLLDQGFAMVQFSVYARFCAGKEQAEAQTRAIERQVPKFGKISILFFTDKQYENTISFTGRERSTGSKKPDQLLLF